MRDQEKHELSGRPAADSGTPKNAPKNVLKEQPGSATATSGKGTQYYRPTVSAYDISRGGEERGPRRKEITLYIPPGWYRMLPAAVVATVVPLLLIMSGCVLAYFSTGGNVWLADTQWTDALTVGVNIWALGYGVTLSGQIDGIQTVLSVSPLGLIWVNLVWSVFVIRRLLGSHRVSAWFFLPTQTLLAGVIGFSNYRAFPVWQLILGAVIMALISVLIALYREETARRKQQFTGSGKARLKARIRYRFQMTKETVIDFFTRMRHPDLAYREDYRQQEMGIDRAAITIEGNQNTWIIPGWVISGIRAGWRIFSFLSVVTFALIAVQLVTNYQQVIEINKLLHINLVGGLILGLAQLCYLPTLQAWGLAWVSGPGFHQGTDTVRSIWDNSVGTYPAVPILAVMPDYTPGTWPILVFLIIATCFGYILYIYQARMDLFYHVATALTAALTLGTLTMTIQTLAAGALGPGRMSLWGAEPLLVTAAVLFEWMLPLSMVMLLLHPTVRKWLTTSLVWAGTSITQKAKSAATHTQELTSKVAGSAQEYLHRGQTAVDKNDTDDASSSESEAETTETPAANPTLESKTESTTGAGDVLGTRAGSAGEESVEAAGETSGQDDDGAKADGSESIGASARKESGRAATTAPNSGLDPIIPPVGKKTRLADLGAQAFAQSRGGVVEAEAEQIREVADKWVKRKVRRVRRAPVQVPKPDLNDPSVPKKPVKRSLMERSQVRIDLYRKSDGKPITAGLPTADTVGLPAKPLTGENTTELPVALGNQAVEEKSEAN